MLITSLPELVWDLLTFGEDEVAERTKAFTSAEQRRVWEIAAAHAERPYNKDGSGMLLAKALALAAVEVAEGAPRPLAWNRRNLKRERPEMPTQPIDWGSLGSN
jgi:hypothetical protein